MLFLIIGFIPTMTFTDIQLRRLTYLLNVYGNGGKYHTNEGQKFIEEILKGGDLKKLKKEIRPPREVSKAIEDILREKN